MNYTLDQFLKYFIEIGIDKIIYIKRQSQSIIFEGKTLYITSKEELKTKSEGYRLVITYKILKAEEKSIKKRLGLLYNIQKR